MNVKWIILFLFLLSNFNSYGQIYNNIYNEVKKSQHKIILVLMNYITLLSNQIIMMQKKFMLLQSLLRIKLHMGKELEAH